MWWQAKEVDTIFLCHFYEGKGQIRVMAMMAICEYNDWSCCQQVHPLLLTQYRAPAGPPFVHLAYRAS